MEKVRPWCGPPSDRARLKNRTEFILLHVYTIVRICSCDRLLGCSVVDAFEVDYGERYPLAAKASYLEFDQLPGDLLIIPTGWFHQVCGVRHVTAYTLG